MANKAKRELNYEESTEPSPKKVHISAKDPLIEYHLTEQENGVLAKSKITQFRITYPLQIYNYFSEVWDYTASGYEVKPREGRYGASFDSTKGSSSSCRCSLRYRDGGLCPSCRIFYY
jgi:hypothetical protein